MTNKHVSTGMTMSNGCTQLDCQYVKRSCSRAKRTAAPGSAPVTTTRQRQRTLTRSWILFRSWLRGWTIPMSSLIPLTQRALHPMSQVLLQVNIRVQNFRLIRPTHLSASHLMLPPRRPVSTKESTCTGIPTFTQWAVCVCMAQDTITGCSILNCPRGTYLTRRGLAAGYTTVMIMSHRSQLLRQLLILWYVSPIAMSRSLSCSLFLLASFVCIATSYIFLATLITQSRRMIL